MEELEDASYADNINQPITDKISDLITQLRDKINV